MYNYFNGFDFLGDCLILETIMEDLDFDTKKYNIDYGIIGKLEDDFIFSEAVYTYPELYMVFTQFRKHYFEDFYFTNVMINHNMEEDGIKRGEVVSLGLGDYRGGNLVIIDDEEKKRVVLRSWQHINRFNSSKYEYYYSNFEGERYNLIWYNN
tara:strand:- start:140 stop:598 length:459 start_codon:yes stop_codon:yes gene_type:complete